jgi:SAM-dependent methyltransferase
MSTAPSIQAISDQPAARESTLNLQCPRCHATLGLWSESESHTISPCSGCGFQFRNHEGIVCALLPERIHHFGRFMQEYQAVRSAEGRGSESSAYYLALPYKDLSGRLQSQWDIRGRTFACLERSVLEPLEASHPEGLAILDLGAGNGWMSYRLSLRGHRPVAVDLILNDRDGLAAARHYDQALPGLFPRFQAELDQLPFANGQFDVAIFNASFHYSEDYVTTLGEALRCLRKKGTIVIADTAWYSSEESGQAMVAERQQSFLRQHGFRSDGIRSQEYLTDQRLAKLEQRLGIWWTVHSPSYGLRWAARPLMAKLKRKREPSRFRIYVAEVVK